MLAIHLTAFVINFPDYGEKVDDSDNDDTYRERPRNSGFILKNISNFVLNSFFPLIFNNEKA